MSRAFNGTSDKVQTSIGAFSATVYGTLAVIYKINTQKAQGLIALQSDVNTARYALELSSAGVLQGGNDTTPSDGPTINISDGWCVLVFGKATGTVKPRYHKCVMSTGVWTHTDGATAIANSSTSPGASGLVQFGSWGNTDFASGWMYAAAAWTARNLTDTEAELLGVSLNHWWSLNPSGMWLFDQHAAGQSVNDVTGNGANQSSISGTSVVLDSPPGFSYGHPIIVS
jgi:hypothetical protein